MVPPPLDASPRFVPSDMLEHEELAAEMEDLRLVSEGTAQPSASVTSSEPARNVDSTVIKESETSGSRTKVPSPPTANPHQHGVTADNDSESEDSDTTPRPSKSAAGPSSGGNSKPSGSSEGNSKPSDKPHHSTTKEMLKTAGIVLGVGAATAAVAVAGAPLVLAGLGFSSSGVMAGSLAAGYQATLGGVIVKGSLFSLCQSWGVLGLSAAANTTVAAASGSIGAAVTSYVVGKGSENEPGDGPDTGSEAETQEVVEEVEGTSGTGKKENGEDTCRECDCGSGTSKAKSTNGELTEETEGQDTCRQNLENEEAAEKQRAFRK